LCPPFHFISENSSLQAGLFSAVLTAFLVQVYAELQPDNSQLSVPILLDISNQLRSISLSQFAPASNISNIPTEEPSNSLVATTSLWFVSLVLSLGAAFYGILVKQWVREYMNWTTVFPAQRAIQVRRYRADDLKKWRVNGIVMFISECLEIGLIFFFLGLGTLLWRVNKTVAMVATISVCLVLLSAIAATVLSAFLLDCPYRDRISFVLTWLRHDVPLHLRYIIIRALIIAAARPTSIRNSTFSLIIRKYFLRASIHLPLNICTSNIPTFLTIGALLRTIRDIPAHLSSNLARILYKFAITSMDLGHRALLWTWAEFSRLTSHLKEWRKKWKENFDSLSRPKDHSNWTDMDISFRLPSQDEAGDLKRISEMCTSLFWLIGHRDVPHVQSLVQQCLSDLQSSYLPPETFMVFREGSETKLIANELDIDHRQLQFQTFCKILLGSMKSSASGQNLLEGVSDLESHLINILPYQTVVVDDRSRPTLSSYAFDDEYIILLSDAMQYADRKSQGAISSYFFRLADRLLDPQVFLPEDLFIVATLFRILFLLWYCSDLYWEQQGQELSINNTVSLTDSQSKSYHYLQQAFKRLLAVPQLTETEDNGSHQTHYDTIIDVLAVGIPGSFLGMLDAASFNGMISFHSDYGMRQSHSHLYCRARCQESYEFGCTLHPLLRTRALADQDEFCGERLRFRACIQDSLQVLGDVQSCRCI
jgi:hypothetical protein